MGNAWGMPFEAVADVLGGDLEMGAVADALPAIGQPPAPQGGIEPASLPTIERIAKLLWVISIITLILTATTMFHNPPSGVVFAHNKLAYYLVLAGIFTLGVAESFTAFWLSRSYNDNRRCFLFGRVVLCASIVPFIAVVSIGGFALSKG